MVAFKNIDITESIYESAAFYFKSQIAYLEFYYVNIFNCQARYHLCLFFDNTLANVLYINYLNCFNNKNLDYLYLQEL